MFYLIQKYCLGLALLFFIAIAYFAFTKAFGDISSFAYIPIIHLYLVFGAGAQLLSLLSLNPLITNGEEALAMKSPLSHFAIHTNFIILMICGPITAYLMQYPDQSWRTEKLIMASIHLGIMSIVSIIAILILFYPLRACARIKATPLDSRSQSS